MSSKGRRLRRFIKYNYRIFLISLCGILVSSTVIVSYAEKMEGCEQKEDIFEIGYKYYTNYGFEEIILSYQNMMQGTALTINEYIDVARQLIQSGETEKAIEILNKAIELNPTFAEAYLELAEIYYSKGDKEKAIQTLKDGYQETRDERLERKRNSYEAAADKKETNKPQSNVKDMLTKKTEAVSDTGPQTNVNVPKTPETPEAAVPDTPAAPDTPAPKPELPPAPEPDTPAPEPDTPRPDAPAPEPDTPRPEPDTPAPDPDTPRPEPDTPRPEPSEPEPDTPRPEPDTPRPDTPAPEADTEE